MKHMNKATRATVFFFISFIGLQKCLFACASSGHNGSDTLSSPRHAGRPSLGSIEDRLARETKKPTVVDELKERHHLEREKAELMLKCKTCLIGNIRRKEIKEKLSHIEEKLKNLATPPLRMTKSCPDLNLFYPCTKERD